VVHERGHLLVGLDSHSADGVMRAKWDFAALQQMARGTLILSANEAERWARYLLGQCQSHRTVANDEFCPKSLLNLEGIRFNKE